MEIKIGLLGTGAIGRSHIERINNKLQGAKVVATTDANSAFGQSIAKQYGLEYFESYQDLVASPGVGCNRNNSRRSIP